MAPEETGEGCACCRSRPVVQRWRPFCSERCKLLDLSRWIDGEYRVPGEPAPAEDRLDGDTEPTSARRPRSPF